MQVKHVVLGLAMAAVLAMSAIARAETAAESFAEGEKLLAKGEFDAALQSYASATRADRSNPDYMQRYAMVRRVIDLRSRLEKETRQQQWEYMARALRSFYASERLYSELLKLDEAIHQRLDSGESASMLAETQLAMEQNANAVQTLSSLDSGKTNAMTQLLLGIAMARNGKTDDAKRIAEQAGVSDKAEPSIAYTAARLHAATGDSTKAMELLKACFEATLPSQLTGLKSHAKTCPDFSAVASTSEFADVLKTESKVPESKCSGGNSCAGCPMRGKCPGSQEEKP